METKTVTLEVKAGPDDGLKEGEFIAYPSTFTREPDAYGDVVAVGAFTETLADWKASGNVMPGLYGHRMDDPDYFVAGAIDTGEDDHGWWVKGLFDLESPKGPQTYRLVKGKRVTQLSFAFDVEQAEEIEIDGAPVRELQKLKVYEFSFVPVGANQDTSIVAIKTNADALAIATKVGRTLSAKNESDIREAVDLLTKVLSQLADDDDKQASSHVKEPPDEDLHDADKSGHAEERASHLSVIAASLALRERGAVT